MSKAKKIVLALLLVIIAIQLVQPARNNSNVVQKADMVTHFNAPANVAGVLKTSCYDCHSNNTRYPWYATVQPIGWLLANHVKDGKEELNFSEFANYSKRRQLSKLKSLQNSIKDGSMPLPSYTLLHNDAKLSGESKALLMQWTTKTIDSLSK
ncbi:MAG: heme-binding domain-containing protein [Bacteroidota bacterium]